MARLTITRRDFLNGILIGMGASLLELPAPRYLLAESQPFDGYGGTGDYAVSNGNTRRVTVAAHKIRDGAYSKLPDDTIDTGEIFDLVIIGGGLSGLGAAHHFRKMSGRDQKCLVLENHPVFGGEAKRNEFTVDGLKLIGPQGSNSFVVPDIPGTASYEIYSGLGLPFQFKYQKMEGAEKTLRFDTTNYGFMLWHDELADTGYYFGQRGSATLVADMWGRDLEGAPFSDKAKKDFRTWRNGKERYYAGEDFEKWLDSMTYKSYLEKVMGLGPDVVRYVDPVLSCSIGLGADAISAFGAYQVAMPGFQGFPGGYTRRARTEEHTWHSFPGGNDGFSRHLVKALIPSAIRGRNRFEDIMNQPVDFGALDRPGQNVRIRLDSLAVSIAHDAAPEKSEYVRVAYAKGGKVYQLRARAVVMACGSWVAKRIVRALPEDYKEAYGQFFRSPMLVVNVAVNNWNFLYKLGVTACRWSEGFGFSCNIRQPMLVGDYRPPLDPHKPAIITLYVPYFFPGLPPGEQGIKGRGEMLATSFSEYERKVLEQMTGLFGKTGFDAKRDVAGIILNRWGHAFVNPQPGFYYGTDNRPAPRAVIRRPFGRIAFAHSELNGHQHWLGAVDEGRRAVKQLMAIL